jgi:hypothetical protein
MAENKKTQEIKEEQTRKQLIQFYIKLENMGLNTKEANLYNNRITYFRGKNNNLNRKGS